MSCFIYSVSFFLCIFLGICPFLLRACKTFPDDRPRSSAHSSSKGSKRRTILCGAHPWGFDFFVL